ncbi:galactokinase [Saonia flava]|uniref:Galactokinase n=1 Tax=Saonia flava TaxID=523696 RepID=A0A846QYF0_9FLAO|nr:galactokinase [Saonia flava]NJB71950.1 galactokinase [Saonia flava]
MKSKTLRKTIEVNSPGRINLIGEHIDYNGGLVLPAAINLRIRLSLKKNYTDTISVWSEDYKKGFKLNLKSIAPSNQQWENYIAGVLFLIDKVVPNKLEGFDCFITSKLPMGSGISSSAALECGIAKGVNALFNLDLSDEELIGIAQQAEHSFVGTNCGVMDQYAVIKGVENGFLLLNCNEHRHTIIPSNLGAHKIVLLNTNVSHNLSTSEYNLRRKECNLALKKIQEVYPEYLFLADVPKSVLLKFKTKMAVHLFKRATYVIEENHRVKKAAKALKKEALRNLGNLMYESHKGLKELYEVSCAELDFLVDFSKTSENVIGSRMMGGGFGGCTINLVHKDYASEFINTASKAYKQEFNIELTPTIVKIGNGVTVHEYEN